MPSLQTCEWRDLDALLWAQRRRLADTGVPAIRPVHGGYEARKPDLEHAERAVYRRWLERRGRTWPEGAE